MKRKIILFISLIFFTLVTPAFAALPQFSPDSTQNQVLLDTLYNPTGVGDQNFGNTGFNKVGFLYTPSSSHWVCQVHALFGKFGHPTDSVQLQLYDSQNTMASAISSGNLDGTFYSLVNGIDLTNSDQSADFIFQAATPPGICLPLHAATNYWFVFSRTGSLSNTDYYLFEENQNLTPRPNASSVIQAWTTTGQSSGFVPSTTVYGITDGTAINNATGSASLTTETCANNILYSLCTLFYPNLSVLSSNFTTLQNTFNSKAPFGYITSALSINLSVTNAASSTPVFTIPIVHSASQIAGILPTSMTYNDSSWGNIVAQWTGAIRTMFNIALWLAFIFYIFVTVRHIF